MGEDRLLVVHPFGDLDQGSFGHHHPLGEAAVQLAQTDGPLPGDLAEPALAVPAGQASVASGVQIGDHATPHPTRPGTGGGLHHFPHELVTEYRGPLGQQSVTPRQIQVLAGDPACPHPHEGLALQGLGPVDGGQVQLPIEHQRAHGAQR
jgi:hypothetical protein